MGFINTLKSLFSHKKDSPKNSFEFTSTILPKGFFVVDDEFRKHPEVEITLPRRSTSKACAYDFFSPEELVLVPGETKLIWTDVKARFSPCLKLAINVRSSMGKPHIALANTQGWIDADYADNISNDGNIGIMLHNFGSEDYVIHIGDRIAQGCLDYWSPINPGEFADEIWVERTGGFGSTGK